MGGVRTREAASLTYRGQPASQPKQRLVFYSLTTLINVCTRLLENIDLD